MEARFCHNCGAKLQENARFCGVCGTPVFQFAPAEPPAPQVQPEPEVVIPEPEPVVTAPVDEIVEPVPVEEIPEPTPVIPAPVEEVPEPTPVIPAPVEEVPEPTPVIPAPVEEVPESTPVILVPVEEIPEPTPVILAPVEEIPEPAPVIPVPVADIPVPTYAAAEVPTPAIAVAAPPVTYEPTPAAVQPEAAPLKKRDVYPRRGAGRTILAVTLCIFIFLWSFAALVLYDARSATSGQQLSKNLETVAKELDLTKLPVSSVIADTADPDQSLIEWAIEEIATTSEGTITVSEKEAKKFLEESTIDDFIYGKIGTYMEDLYSNSGESAVSKEEIVTLLDENTALIEETFGVTVELTEIADFADQIEELGVLEYLEPKTLKTEAAPVYYAVQFGLSYWVIGFFGVLALLFMLMLAGNNKWKMLRTSRDIGVTLTVLGALMSVAALFTKLLPDVWASIFGSNKLIGTISGAALYSGLIPALIVTGAGILLILICVVGKAIIFKSAKNRSK